MKAKPSLRLMRVEKGARDHYRCEMLVNGVWAPFAETHNIGIAMGKLSDAMDVETVGGELVLRIPYGAD